jgi:hypothetical protein
MVLQKSNELSGIIGECLSLTVPHFFPLQIATYIIIINLCSGISTLHAIFITVMSLYFVFWSDLFSDQQLSGIVTFRSSPLSVFALGVKFDLFVFNKYF